MAPSLRSSAPSTPTSKASVTSELTTPTRKTPTCSKCKRPRVGHPRSGCPYTDTPSKMTPTQTPSSPNKKDIEHALKSMNLASPTYERDEDTKAAIRDRRRSSRGPPLTTTETLLSLDGESQEIIERLLQPGMFDDDTEGSPKKATKVVRWQETLSFIPVTTSTNNPKRAKMPGSLFSPESSLGSIITEKPDLAEPSATPSLADTGNSTTLNRPVSAPSFSAPQRSADSMSIEQRNLFITSLNNFSDATVYVVPRDDIYNLQAEAIKLQFYARIVLTKDPNDPQGLLVLGSNETAVKSLHERVEMEHKKTSRFRTAAGGAVVGAVGTFAGLAFV